MKFQSEKKELWRYASKNLAEPARGTNSQQPLPRHLPHQHLPQSVGIAMMTQHPLQESLLGYCEGYCESSTSSTTAMNISRQENVNTPPPPYSSVPELDCSSNATMRDYCFTYHQSTYPTDGEREASLLGAESDLGYCRKRAPSTGGCNYVNSGDIMLVVDYEKLKDTSTSSSYQLPAEQQQKVFQTNPVPNSQAVSTSTITTTTTSTASFAATAAKILRNCCGGTFGSSNSVTSTRFNINTSNNATTNACSMLHHEHSQRIGVDLANSSNNYLPEQYFSTLMKQLKASQISLLLKAVKSRQDPIIPIMPPPSASSTASQHCCVANYQTNCILIRRAEILGEEPYVIACRLFFWRDLKCASQLKRLPVCPNERDPVYVCCNPLHWCRILETDTAPPPYQSRTMKRTEGLNSGNGVNSATIGKTDPDNIPHNYSDVRTTRLTESVTTDGEERHCSGNWCEVAYWEMAQRVGERFPADTATINIFSDKPHTTSEEHKNGMCLKDLIEKRTTPSPEDVQYTRQKIGLGVTLSQEADGVWLYNRSNVPVFVYSPTLTESWYRVCRVEPGDCIRAFDKYRAQTLVYPGSFAGGQTGPIDKFSMRISFGKGWGCTYKRPDITLCPCWLEVLFKPQR